MCRVGDFCGEDDEREPGTLLPPPLRLEKSLISSNTLTVYNPFDQLYKLDFQPRDGKTLYLSRHGESEYNVFDMIGGNPNLTQRGAKYAKAMGNYFNKAAIPNLHVWTSSLVRTIQTAAHVTAPKFQTPLLDEISSGDLDSLTYAEVEEKYPLEFKARVKDKLRYRYPAGESYIDCCHRLIPVLERVERCNEPLLIVAHQAILRCMVSYLLHGDIRDVPNCKIPQHCLMRVTSVNGENVIDYIRTPIEHIEQGVVPSLLPTSTSVV